MKGYLAYSGTQCLHSTGLHSTGLHSTDLNSTDLHSTGLNSTGSHSTTAALSRARTRSLLTLIPRPAPGGEPQPPATPKRQRKPKTANTDVVEYGWMPSFYRAAA